MNEPEITYIKDSDVDASLDLNLRQLISFCFKQSPLMDKRYFNEPPQHRWFVVDENDQLAAHLAVHEKVFSVENREEAFIGIAEVCVTPQQRGRGLVKMLLAQAETHFPAIDYSILLGDEKIYGSSHYLKTNNVFLPDVSEEPSPDVLVKCSGR